MGKDTACLDLYSDNCKIMLNVKRSLRPGFPPKRKEVRSKYTEVM
jgi:hypothetical protein